MIASFLFLRTAPSVPSQRVRRPCAGVCPPLSQCLCFSRTVASSVVSSLTPSGWYFMLLPSTWEGWRSLWFSPKNLMGRLSLDSVNLSWTRVWPSVLKIQDPGLINLGDWGLDQNVTVRNVVIVLTRGSHLPLEPEPNIRWGCWSVPLFQWKWSFLKMLQLKKKLLHEIAACLHFLSSTCACFSSVTLLSLETYMSSWVLGFLPSWASNQLHGGRGLGLSCLPLYP